MPSGRRKRFGLATLCVFAHARVNALGLVFFPLPPLNSDRLLHSHTHIDPYISLTLTYTVLPCIVFIAVPLSFHHTLTRPTPTHRSVVAARPTPISASWPTAWRKSSPSCSRFAANARRCNASCRRSSPRSGMRIRFSMHTDTGIHIHCNILDCTGVSSLLCTQSEYNFPCPTSFEA